MDRFLARGGSNVVLVLPAASFDVKRSSLTKDVPAAPRSHRREPCVWCHRADGARQRVAVVLWGYFAWRRYEETFAVHPEHEASFRAYVERFERHGRLFFAIAGVLAVSLLALPFASARYGLGDGDVLMLAGAVVASGGALLAVFPFCTPRQVHGISLQGARQLLRVVGIGDIGLGAVLITLGLFL